MVKNMQILSQLKPAYLRLFRLRIIDFVGGDLVGSDNGE